MLLKHRVTNKHLGKPDYSTNLETSFPTKQKLYDTFKTLKHILSLKNNLEKVKKSIFAKTLRD